MEYSYADGILICGWDTHMRMGHRTTKATIRDDGDDGDRLVMIDDDDTVDSERREEAVNRRRD
jgi:hypothetical protein